MTTYNFSSGPAVLPREVLLQVQQELTDWHGSGMSVMEMSHRGPEFTQIISEAEADLRAVLGIPANYKVLFLQGGAHFQFAMLPLNLTRPGDTVDYVNTGSWSKAAIKEAQRYANVNVVASSEDRNFSYLPDEAGWARSSNAAYLYYVSNETIGGVEFPFIPQASFAGKDIPLICDMSSNILSQPLDVSRYGVIFAGAQKNIGPSGMTLAIVREDLIGHARPDVPTMLDFKTHADAGSLYNTPPTFAIYVAGLVFKWLQKNGGLEAMARHNAAKAALVYDAIDHSAGFYRAPVSGACRSRMNVPFWLKDATLDAEFLKGADAAGLVQLKGHRSVGGMRASIYNAMPLEGVQALVAYMNDFARRHG